MTVPLSIFRMIVDLRLVKESPLCAGLVSIERTPLAGGAAAFGRYAAMPTC